MEGARASQKIPRQREAERLLGGVWTLPIKLNYNDDFPACAVYKPGMKNEADSQPIPGMPGRG